MGVDIETYRRRIGSHALRVNHVANRSSSVRHGDNDGVGDFEFSSGNSPDSTWLLPRTVYRLTRSRARAGLLATMLFVALWVMATLQDGSACKNLHDLSSLILNAGDIEEDPGPGSTAGSEATADSESAEEISQMRSDVESLEAKWEQQFRDLERKMQGRVERLEAQLAKQKGELVQIADCWERDVHEVVRAQVSIQRDMSDLSTRVNEVVSDLSTRVDEVADYVQNINLQNEDQADKTEGMFIRNNIKMYGVYEGERESYWSCVQTVLNVLREALPTVPWSEKDIVRVQRLGPARGNNRYKPRPLLVQMNTLLDKLTLLKFGRRRKVFKFPVSSHVDRQESSVTCANKATRLSSETAGYGSETQNLMVDRTIDHSPPGHKDMENKEKELQKMIATQRTGNTLLETSIRLQLSSAKGHNKSTGLNRILLRRSIVGQLKVNLTKAIPTMLERNINNSKLLQMWAAIPRRWVRMATQTDSTYMTTGGGSRHAGNLKRRAAPGMA